MTDEVNDANLCSHEQVEWPDGTVCCECGMWWTTVVDEPEPVSS